MILVKNSDGNLKYIPIPSPPHNFGSFCFFLITPLFPGIQRLSEIFPDHKKGSFFGLTIISLPVLGFLPEYAS